MMMIGQDTFAGSAALCVRRYHLPATEVHFLHGALRCKCRSGLRMRQ